MSQNQHISVLKQELINFLNLRKGMTVVDGTLGLGGHAEAVSEQIGESGTLIGIDLDEKNLAEAKKRLSKFKNRIFYFHGNFDNLRLWLNEAGIKEVDAIYLDLGLSSPQVDEPERGFSFLREGPLDMRFDQQSNGDKASDLINRRSEHELEWIFREYGEEKRARRMAEKIIEARKEKPILTTKDLAEIIEKIAGRGLKGQHPATKIFQALRIAVNKELEALQKGLEQALLCLNPNGRLAVMAYHSLEDRIVKNTFKKWTQTCFCPKEKLICDCNLKAKVKIITKKPIIPSPAEISQNKRSRSAKMRVVERI